MPLQMHSSLAVHPGDWLKTEVIGAQELKVTEAAALLGVTRETLSRLLNSRARISLAMATRFETVFLIPANTMMRMQADWDSRTAAPQA